MAKSSSASNQASGRPSGGEIRSRQDINEYRLSKHFEENVWAGEVRTWDKTEGKMCSGKEMGYIGHNISICRTPSECPEFLTLII